MTLASADAARSMDRMYRRQRHIYDLTRKPYLLGRDGLIRGLRPPPGGAVLEIGCGTGRNLVQAARLFPAADFYGLDVSQAMLATARRALAARGLQQRVRLAQADAVAFEPERLFGRQAFDRIFISYALSMIPEWRQLLTHAIALLTPAGSLHVVDFGRQDHLPAWFRTLLRAWLARFDVTPRDDLEAALDGLARPRDLRPVCRQLYGGYAVAALVTRSGAPRETSHPQAYAGLRLR